ncbi:MAG: hypothetical protein ABSB35_38455, partial [Bryobacteraceae bacterium]
MYSCHQRFLPATAHARDAAELFNDVLLKFGFRRGLRPEDHGFVGTYLGVRQDVVFSPRSYIGSPQEFVTSGILRGFPGFLKSDVFGVGHGYAPCFQQEVTH